ncbi:hypothetical protein FNV43_RR10236 [Rhamnella rubrinervis]|uniref:Uncharacterized protein n=1 Tax=Rhamnella rubrinervis TaxID=2594499 RepID=A0A8K0HC97_9ROSA|nr:hypothetical protein FNV43_RR10236 [Rhamnella rubrinervis]
MQFTASLYSSASPQFGPPPPRLVHLLLGLPHLPLGPTSLGWVPTSSRLFGLHPAWSDFIPACPPPPACRTPSPALSHLLPGHGPDLPFWPPHPPTLSNLLRLSPTSSCFAPLIPHGPTSPLGPTSSCSSDLPDGPHLLRVWSTSSEVWFHLLRAWSDLIRAWSTSCRLGATSPSFGPTSSLVWSHRLVRLHPGLVRPRPGLVRPRYGLVPPPSAWSHLLRLGPTSSSLGPNLPTGTNPPVWSTPPGLVRPPCFIHLPRTGSDLLPFGPTSTRFARPPLGLLDLLRVWPTTSASPNSSGLVQLIRPSPTHPGLSDHPGFVPLHPLDPASRLGRVPTSSRLVHLRLGLRPASLAAAVHLAAWSTSAGFPGTSRLVAPPPLGPTSSRPTTFRHGPSSSRLGPSSSRLGPTSSGLDPTSPRLSDFIPGFGPPHPSLVRLPPAWSDLQGRGSGPPSAWSDLHRVWSDRPHATPPPLPGAGPTFTVLGPTTSGLVHSSRWSDLILGLVRIIPLVSTSSRVRLHSSLVRLRPGLVRTPLRLFPPPRGLGLTSTRLGPTSSGFAPTSSRLLTSPWLGPTSSGFGPTSSAWSHLPPAWSDLLRVWSDLLRASSDLFDFILACSDFILAWSDFILAWSDLHLAWSDLLRVWSDLLSAWSDLPLGLVRHPPAWSDLLRVWSDLLRVGPTSKSLLLVRPPPAGPPPPAWSHLLLCLVRLLPGFVRPASAWSDSASLVLRYGRSLPAPCSSLHGPTPPRLGPDILFGPTSSALVPPPGFVPPPNSSRVGPSSGFGPTSSGLVRPPPGLVRPPQGLVRLRHGLVRSRPGLVRPPASLVLRLWRSPAAPWYVVFFNQTF